MPWEAIDQWVLCERYITSAASKTHTRARAQGVVNCWFFASLFRGHFVGCCFLHALRLIVIVVYFCFLVDGAITWVDCSNVHMIRSLNSVVHRRWCQLCAFRKNINSSSGGVSCDGTLWVTTHSFAMGKRSRLTVSEEGLSFFWSLIISRVSSWRILI